MNPVFLRAWSPLRYHAVQRAFWESRAKFQVVVAGRRSGKTDISKRKLVRAACAFRSHHNGLFVYACPTRPQAKKNGWQDLKALVPLDARAGRPRESDLEIRLVNGASVVVVGMDRPERIEGVPIDGIVCDEFADWRERAFNENVSPSLTNVGREGWAILTGVPGGRNHYFREYQRALAEVAKKGAESRSAVFHWKSSSVLTAEQILLERERLDELTFRQEWEASFLSFEGAVYYGFRRETHAAEPVAALYDRRAPLDFCFDFNVAPGVAVVAQTLPFHRDRPDYRGEVGREISAVIGEVWIPRNSNTPAVCRKLVADWGPGGRDHRGPVRVFGDATGGARRSSATEGSDWDLVRSELKGKFAGGVDYRVPRENPTERARVNTMNTRLLSSAGKMHLLVDPAAAPHVVEDLEGVVWLKGGAEIEKKPGGERTHLTDALGYRECDLFPLNGGSALNVRYAG